ncbi:LiaI-LiaF-like domain-containing protein [Pedobacter glucosidilyticus]|uniref:LiaI-LiaF-like domain-containing protein n=1 Tax=Pedobacter glucosidilyticus TaxID=1122941 RepID=UPI00040B3064|nr:DUF5668 domain-containing protein [Pedobacter glucosidilyticus]
MKTDRIFWGIILVYIGGIILLENFNMIDFSWRYIWRFWPLVLIVTGINILFAKRKTVLATVLIASITILSLGFITYKGLNNDTHTGITWSNDDEIEVDKDATELNAYTETYDPRFKIVKLEVSGGASSFVIDEYTDNLFEANIKGAKARYILKKTDQDSTVNLDFTTNNNKDFNFKDEEYSKIKLFLNTNPLWDISLKMGAGKATFDLSDYKVRTLDLEGGAAKFDIKIGSLQDSVSLSAETGVAKVVIKIPENAGCLIENTSELSSRKFDGFKENEVGDYETSNFKTAKQKIYINFKGGLSDFEVRRY